MDVDETEKDVSSSYLLAGLSMEQGNELIRSCVGLLANLADSDTLHAAMRLCLRLTRDYAHAETFANVDGVKHLLNLGQSSAFPGFLTLATLLLRHLVEEPKTLYDTMEKVLRVFTGPNTAPSTKEFYRLMRALTPAACRDVQQFTEVSKAYLRVDLSLANERGDKEDNRLLMKMQPPCSDSLPQLSRVAKDVVCKLLDALTIPVPTEETTTPSPAAEADGSASSHAARRYAGRNVRQQELVRNSSYNGLLNHEPADDQTDESRLIFRSYKLEV